jgi:6-phosphogluconolactonase
MTRFLSCLLTLTLAGTASAETVVYVSVAADKKIAVYVMDPKTGALVHRDDAKVEAGEPGALATDPQKRFLFAAIRSTGKLSAFRIDPKTGKLTHLNTVDAGPDPAHISTDKEGRFLLCAYYVAAKVTVHAIGQDGTLSARPLQSLATADKAHAIVLDLGNHFAFVPHTGPNAIFQFTFDGRSGELKPNAVPKVTTPPGTGPRHLVFHTSKEIVYVDNEQGSSVTAYRLDPKAGTLSPQGTVPTLPEDFKGTNACAEIKIHPSGKYLYVSNRGHDSIACFTVDAKDGKLTANGQAPTEKTPRGFDLDPDGHFLFAAGEGNGKLAAYRVHADKGTLERLATYDVGRMPWWVMSVRLP